MTNVLYDLSINATSCTHQQGNVRRWEGGFVETRRWHHRCLLLTMTPVLLRRMWRAEVITATVLGHRGGQGVRPLQWIMPLMCTIDCRSDQCGFQGSDLTVSLHSLPSMPPVQQHMDWCCWGPVWQPGAAAASLGDWPVIASQIWCIKDTRLKLLTWPSCKELAWSQFLKNTYLIIPTLAFLHG